MNLDGAEVGPEATYLLALYALLLLALAGPSQAVDGVIEINQASALAGGVTVGDAAGSRSKSTRLGAIG